MAENAIKRVDVTPGLSGKDQLKLLFAAKGTSITAWALSEGITDSYIWMCVTGRRPARRLRAMMAAFLGKPVSLIDRLIDGEPDSPATVAAATAADHSD